MLRGLFSCALGNEQNQRVKLRGKKTLKHFLSFCHLLELRSKQEYSINFLFECLEYK